MITLLNLASEAILRSIIGTVTGWHVMSVTERKDCDECGYMDSERLDVVIELAHPFR